MYASIESVSKFFTNQIFSEEKVNQSEVKDEVETEPVTPTKALRGRGRGRGRLRGKLTSRRSSRFHHVDLESDPAKATFHIYIYKYCIVERDIIEVLMFQKPDSDEEAANLVIDESDEKPQNEELEAKFVPTQPSNRARGRGTAFHYLSYFEKWILS